MRALVLPALMLALLAATGDSIKLPSKNAVKDDGTIWADLKNHQGYGPNTWTEHGGRADTVHENAHGINSDVQHYAKRAGVGIYLGDDGGYVFKQPGVSLDAIEARIPAELKASRLKLYMGQARQYKDPLKFIEEWVCYLHGARAAWETESVARTDHTFAPVEMAVYGCTLLEVIERDDPNYEQLRAIRMVVDWLVDQSWCYYELGAVSPRFQGFGDEYVAKLKATKQEWLRKKMRI